jgi:hypothetical protein
MSQVTVVAGFVWGIVAAVVMMMVMRATGGDAPPPFAVFWAKFIGDGDPEAAMPESLSLHFSYGGISGAVYVLIFDAFDLGYPITELAGGALWGLVWGIVLMMVAAVFWVNLLLNMDPGKKDMMSMGSAHLAYGLTLGILGALIPHLL